jgi:hypothetical protein
MPGPSPLPMGWELSTCLHPQRQKRKCAGSAEVPRSAPTAEGGRCTEYRDNRRPIGRNYRPLNQLRDPEFHRTGRNSRYGAARPWVVPRGADGGLAGRHLPDARRHTCKPGVGTGIMMSPPTEWALLATGRASRPGGRGRPCGPQNASVQPTPAGRQAGWPLCCGGYRHYGRAASYSPGRPWSLDGAAQCPDGSLGRPVAFTLPQLVAESPPNRHGK